ncbi:MAG: cell division initiation protein [Actinomycetota bacterium]|jgi:DivIVA domain-containing protein|nr:cell division initiation protein [Actinomycetota bacterium]
MDVTPRELRDVEIREAFRGYNRDEVNDLLERAAAAIEALNERARVLGERLAAGQVDSGRGRETEDMLHRTLLLAQRASDEAIAEAEEKSRVMIEEAETRSRRMLADAAIEARRATDSERRRLEQEINELQTRRDALSTDVDGLEHFETDYRSRLVSAMEADLHAIETDLERIRERAAALPGEKPAISTLGSATGAAPSYRDDPVATTEVDMRSFVDDSARPLVGSGSGVPSSEPISEAAHAAASEMVGANAPEREDADAPQASAESQGRRQDQGQATIDLFGAEQASESAALDDDSFFASLRDAVRDDAPLGPRDESERAFFDQDSKDSPAFREAFKRRR